MTSFPKVVTTIALYLTVSLFTQANADADDDRGAKITPDKARVIEYWTPQRIQAAIPRELVIDERGQGYLRKPDGSLVPYGRLMSEQVSKQGIQPAGRPSGGGSSDTTPPSINNMDPGTGDTIGSSYMLSATITDESGIKSAAFYVQKDGGLQQSFNPSAGANSIWSVSLQGFSDGNWSWWAVAKDGAGKGGNSGTSDLVNFTVDTSNGSGSGSGDGGSTQSPNTITNAEWTAGGAVQSAAGRIYFEMPGNPKRKRWVGYVCSGTVVNDTASDRSIILTAAHCVYDDINQAFARNVLFIPDQAGTSGTGTDLNCGNDPMGCWTPSFGAVDVNWTTNIFPDNIAWDYAYYVVNSTGAHSGASTSSESLEDVTGTLPISFATPLLDNTDPVNNDDVTHALGYSYSEDPKFMYCAEEMTTEGNANWWLANCDLSGGSSGGPWVQPMDTGSGSGNVISVNSWGYTTAPGMAGPKLDTSSAENIYNMAILQDMQTVSDTDGDEGFWW